MAQVKDEKISDTSLNGPNAHHGPNANHKPKDEFHGGGRGGRGNRFQPYGGPNRDRKGGPPRDNNMPRGDFRNDNNHGDNHQGDNDIMNRGNRNHSEGGRGGRRGGGVGGGVFRGGPPNRGDDRLTRADALWNERLMQIMGPTHELPPTDSTERKFLSQCRLYIGNLVDCTEDELIEMFKPYGEVSENFLNKEKMFAFIRLDYRANAEKAKRELDGQTRKGRMLKIRFAPIAAAIKVKNLTPFVSNELLEYAFSIFGDIERCQVMVDERGNSTGEGIIEFSRKNAASNALKRCSEGCFFLTSSLRPCVVETYEFVDSSDGLPDKLLPKKTMDFQKQRDTGPRFANPNSFEHEFGTRWKQLAELYKSKEEALKREMKLEEEKLEAQMEYARYEHETEMLREQLRQREMDRERQKMEWEMKERQAEDQRLREEDIFRRQSEDLSMRMHHQDEEMRRRQQDNSSFMQDHRGGPGKPQFDGPPIPVEAQGGMENQVSELHRVYRRQRELMDEIKRRKLAEDHLHLQALESKSFLSQLRSEISQKSHCPLVFDLTSIEPSTLPRETFQGSSNCIAGQGVPPGAHLLTEQNVTNDRKISPSESSASRKRMLDLELPAEEYVDIEDGEQYARESPVQEPNILISELQPSHSSKVNFVPGDSSISNSNPRGSFLLFDLNEPIQPDETGYPNSALESITVHEDISNMDLDLSGTVHAERSTLKKEVTGGDISNVNSSDEVSSVENQTASSSSRFVDKSHNGTKADKSLLVSSRKRIKEIPFAVQALPCFITNASLSKSPKSSVGNSCLTGKKSDQYNSSASSPTSGTSSSCLMKYGDNESTSGKIDDIKLSKIPDSMSSMKGMDLNCTPSDDLSGNQFSTPTSNISHLNLPEDGERELCKTVLLDCIPSPDSAVESGKSTRDNNFVGPGSDSKSLTTNSCINMSSTKEETFSPGHCEETTTPVDRDLEAPVSPENKECSPPRGDSPDKTIDKSVQWSKTDHMSDRTDNTDSAAAETLLFISSSVVRGHSKTAQGRPSEASHDTLGWLADIATSLASNPEKEVGEFMNLRCHRSTLISDESNCNEVVKLTRKGGNMDNYGHQLKVGKGKEAVCSTLRSRTRRSRPKRENYQSILQREVHPAGPSVCLHQLRGDLLAVGGLKSPANAPRRASLRSSKCSPIVSRTTCSLLQPHPSNDKQGKTDRFWKNWGLTKERQNSRRARDISSFS